MTERAGNGIDSSDGTVAASRAGDALLESLSVGVSGGRARSGHDGTRDSSCSVVVVSGIELRTVVANGADSTDERSRAGSLAHVVGAHVITAVVGAVVARLASNHGRIDGGVVNTSESSNAGEAGGVVLGTESHVVSTRFARE